MAYNTFKQHQPEEIESDEYPFLYARVLEIETDPNAALAFLRNAERDETDRGRKARFALLQGQIEGRRQNYAAARAEYQRVLNEYASRAEAINKASFHQAQSYFDEGDRERGRALLEDWVFADEDPFLEAPPLDPQWKRTGLTRLGLAYQQEGDWQGAAALYERAGSFGGPQQHLKGKMQAWQTRLLHDDAQATLLEIGSLLPAPAQLDSMLTGALPVSPERLALLEATRHDHLRAQLLYLQSQALIGTRREDEVLQVLERLLAEHPESAYTDYARTRLEN